MGLKTVLVRQSFSSFRAQHEFGEEINLLAVTSFCLHLVVVGGAEVLQTLGVLALVEQHLVNHDDEFAVPVVVKLAADCSCK